MVDYKVETRDNMPIGTNQLTTKARARQTKRTLDINDNKDKLSINDADVQKDRYQTSQ